MVKKPQILAIVPARGGSKSLPRKNIKLLNNIPLIAYSIAAGLQTKLVDRVIVSTDDQEIAEIAKKFGAELPFMRPLELGQDDTLDLPVFQHALDWLLRHENYIPDVVVQLRPTSPFRPPGSVDQAIQILINNKSVDSVRTVVPSGQNPYKMWRLNKEIMKPLLRVPNLAEPYNSPRQKLPETFWQTGHIDVITTKTIVKNNSMSGKHIAPLILDYRYAIDIDTEFNWLYAEWVIKKLNLPIITP